jgi:putative oxidoreductase
VAVAALGPGRWSIDRLLVGEAGCGGGSRAAGLAAGLGLAAAAVQLAVFWRRPA